jgi:hypothetical protein
MVCEWVQALPYLVAGAPARHGNGSFSELGKSGTGESASRPRRLVSASLGGAGSGG